MRLRLFRRRHPTPLLDNVIEKLSIEHPYVVDSLEATMQWANNPTEENFRLMNEAHLRYEEIHATLW